MNLLKKKHLILLIIVLSASSFAFYNNEKSINENKKSLSIKQVLLINLTAELPRLNKELPKKIDNSTVLTLISLSGDNVINIHQLPNHKNSDISSDTIQNSIIPHLVKTVCENSDQRTLIENGIGILMKYYDSSNEFIFKVLIDKNRCLIYEHSQKNNKELR